jgi:hypothetical protein
VYFVPFFNLTTLFLLCHITAPLPPPAVDVVTAVAATAAREAERNKLAAERLRAQLLGDTEAERAIERQGTALCCVFLRVSFLCCNFWDMCPSSD